jgi:hypothetical protein
MANSNIKISGYDARIQAVILKELEKTVQKLTGADTDDAFIESFIDQIRNDVKVGTVGTKTTPNLMPVDSKGNPISFDKGSLLISQHANNIENLVQQISFISDPSGEKWKKVSGTLTSISGGKGTKGVQAGGPYTVERRKVDPTRIITASSALSLETEANKAILKNDAITSIKEGISNGSLPSLTYTPKGTLYAVDYEITGVSAGEDNSRYIVVLVIEANHYSVVNTRDPANYTVTVRQGAAYVAGSSGGGIDIEHGIADAYRPAKEYVDRVENLATAASTYLDEQITRNHNNPEIAKSLNKIKNSLDESVKEMRIQLQALQLATRMIGETFPDATFDELIAFYTNLVRQGKDLGFHVVYRDAQNSLTYRNIKVDANIELLLKSGKLFFPGRSYLNQFKGNLEKYFKNSLPKLLVFKRSPSAISTHLINALRGVLTGNAKNKHKKSPLLPTKSSYASGKNFVSFNKSKGIKGGKPAKTPPKVSKAPPKREAPEYLGAPPSTLQNTDLLALINKDIRDAVIDNMKRPALENRTGRFASSVKILGMTPYQNNYIVSYVYRKNPYSIFSTTGGRAPWNTPPNRNPETIIQKAIVELANRYNLTGMGFIMKEGM